MNFRKAGRTLSWLIGGQGLAIALLTLASAVQAQFTYTTTNGTVTITGYTGPGGDVAIPSTILVDGSDLPVTSIGDFAFYSSSGNNTLTNVTIPNSVTNIGNQAFRNCYRLTLTIPNSVSTIRSEAFSADRVQDLKLILEIDLQSATLSPGYAVSSGASKKPK